MTVLVPSTDQKDFVKIAVSLHQLAAGRSNAYGSVTLTENAATTTVTDANVSVNSVISLMPTNAASATEFGAGTWYIGTVSNGSFVITHVNSATAGRTFKYLIHG